MRLAFILLLACGIPEAVQGRLEHRLGEPCGCTHLEEHWGELVCWPALGVSLRQSDGGWNTWKECRSDYCCVWTRWQP